MLGAVSGIQKDTFAKHHEGCQANPVNAAKQSRTTFPFFFFFFFLMMEITFSSTVAAWVEPMQVLL